MYKGFSSWLLEYLLLLQYVHIFYFALPTVRFRVSIELFRSTWLGINAGDRIRRALKMVVARMLRMHVRSTMPR